MKGIASQCLAPVCSDRSLLARTRSQALTRVRHQICIDGRMALHSGIGTYICNVVPRLNSYFDIHLLIDKDLLGQKPELASCRPIFTKTPIYSIREQWELSRRIPRVDLFWSPHFNIPIGPISSSRRLVTIHDVCFLAHPEFLRWPQRVYARMMIRQAVHRSDHIVTDSEFSKQEIVRLCIAERDQISVVPLGVEVPPSSFVDIELPKQFLLFVGNLRPHKNIKGLFQAFEMVMDRFPELHLVLAGMASSSYPVEPPPKIKHRVRLLGVVDPDTLRSLYYNAAALVHPSFYEGFGLTPLEAMACLCPTVVSRAASLPEVCAEASEYVDPHTPSDISRGICRVLEDHAYRSYLQNQGKLRVAQMSWDHTAERMKEVILVILAKNS